MEKGTVMPDGITGRDATLDSILRILDAHDARHSERLTALQEMMKISLEAHSQLAERTETSFEKRLEAMNHFRNEFRSLVGGLATKKEVELMYHSLNEAIQVQRSRLDIQEGKGKGLSLGWGYLIGVVSLIAGIASTFMVLSRHIP